MAEKFWHTVYGDGILINRNGLTGDYIIKFGKKTVILSKEHLGVSLFYSENHFISLKRHNPNSYEYVEKYVLKTEFQREIFNKIKTSINSRNGMCKFEINSINENEPRLVMVLFKKNVTIQRKNYIELICLDMFSGIPVKIIDTNGKSVLLHSYSGQIDSLKLFSIFTATFKIVNDNKHANIFRITSNTDVIDGDSSKVYKKAYRRLFGYNLLCSFDEIKKYKSLTKKHFYTLANFKHTKIKTHNGNKFQIKMGEYFVNISKNCKDSAMLKDGICFLGPSLLSIQPLDEENSSIMALQLFGYIEGTERYEKHNNYLFETMDASNYYYFADNDFYEYNDLDEYDAFDECDDSYFYDWYGFDRDDHTTRIDSMIYDDID